MTRMLAMLLACALGCGSGYVPRLHPSSTADTIAAPVTDQAACDKLNSAARGWGASTAFSAALAGSSGIGVASADLKANQGAQIGLGVTVAILSAWSALSAYLASSYSAQRSAQCVPARAP